MGNKELRCKIAGLNVLISLVTSDTRLISQAQSYLCDFEDTPHIKIKFNEEFLYNRINETPILSLPECEYIWTGFDFAKKLLSFGGFILHASAVCYNGKAYLFSAPSGTGKSTHTSLWQKVFGSEAVIINDDKPAIREVDGKLYVFGTPWSGKSDKSQNICVPLGGICFISRSKTNSIKKVDKKTAINLLLGEILRYPSREYMENFLDFIDVHLPYLHIYEMGCNMEDDAPITSYKYMSENSEGLDFYEN